MVNQLQGTASAMNDSRLLSDIQQQEPSLARVLAHQFGQGHSALVEAARLLRSAHKIVVTGIGASLHAAFPLHYELAANGFDSSIVESGELLHYQKRLCSGATVVVVSRSGESVEIVKLLSGLKQIAEHTIGVTNEPASTLAKEANIALAVDNFPDEMVAIQSYTGTVAALLLLVAEVTGDFDKTHREMTALLPRISALITSNRDRIQDWDDFLEAASPVYLLGRGPSHASALEGALLFSETAKEPAVGIASGSFRHGPVEIVDANFRAVVFAPHGKTRDLNLGLAQDLVKFGAKVRVIGPVAADAGALSLIDVPGVPEKFAPLVDIIPVQLAALRLAHRKGLVIGKFRYAPQVTRNEMSF
jgi:glucosamine--fructose-6-phosphate aminotransferase (isomerizing)